jgi:hypothetical protein
MQQRDPFAPFQVTKKSQLTTKSDQWFDDAEHLRKAERYAAALYLGGFVVECLLKASLWDRRFESHVRPLLYSHDLSALRAANGALDGEMQADRLGVHEQFVRLSNWTVRVRYNPRKVARQDAEDFMRRLKEVRGWLRSRV